MKLSQINFEIFITNHSSELLYGLYEPKEKEQLCYKTNEVMKNAT